MVFSWAQEALAVLSGGAVGFCGMRAAVRLAANRRSLTFVFAGIIFAVAAYMLVRTGIPPWLSI